MNSALPLLAQQTMPVFDGLYWLNLTSRILHILGAILILGGLFYLRAVVMPSPAAETASTVDEKFGGLRSKWAMCIRIAIVFLLATGFWNFFQIIRTYDLARSYHMIFGLHFVAAIAFFALAEFVAGRSAAAEVIRSKMKFWVGVSIALGILTVALGSMMRTIPHNPKIDSAPPPTLVAPANAAADQG